MGRSTVNIATKDGGKGVDSLLLVLVFTVFAINQLLCVFANLLYA